jgi:hypothetical protein
LRRSIVLFLAAAVAAAACGSKPVRSPTKVARTVRGATVADTLLGAEEEVFEYDDHGARDPFVPVWIGRRVPGAKQTARPVLKVSAIAWDAVSPTAIINDRLVREGDVVDGAKVAKIGQSSVTMTFAGQSFTVRP